MNQLILKRLLLKVLKFSDILYEQKMHQAAKVPSVIGSLHYMEFCCDSFQDLIVTLEY